METPQSPEERAERRDRALVRRRRFNGVAAAGGVAGVSLVGYLVAVAPSQASLQPVAAVRTVNTVITVGEDGVISKTTTTSLSPGGAATGAATSAVTVTGGSTVARKP